MTYLGRIFRCLPMYYHLVDCIYWEFIASNILYRTTLPTGKGTTRRKI